MESCLTGKILINNEFSFARKSVEEELCPFNAFIVKRIVFISIFLHTHFVLRIGNFYICWLIFRNEKFKHL